MRWRILLLICSIFLCWQNLVSQDTLTLTPPMGWNSWDGYGTTINEAQVKANAQWMAEHLKAFGWQYVTVDMEWFVSNPTAEGNSKTFQYSLDQNGRYTPAVNRFPSAANGAGFKPLADYVHSLGLKFGIHILRGIPKRAVVNKLPIADSSYSAADGADSSDTCPWNFDNFGTNPAQPAAQAYYDSIAKMYASWGVDLIKVDCISSHPYNGDDIRMIRRALDKAGRPIVLSLSPARRPQKSWMRCASTRRCGGSPTTFGISGTTMPRIRRGSAISSRTSPNGRASLNRDIGPTPTCFRSGVWGPLRDGASRAILGLVMTNSEC